MPDKKDSKNIWKSIKEYQEDPEVLKAKLHEFQEGVTDEFHPDEMNNVSRRKFLAVLAASTAFADNSPHKSASNPAAYYPAPASLAPCSPASGRTP